MSFGGIWQIDIQKQLGTEYWTNVYFSDAGTLPAAKTVGDNLVANEKLIHANIVNFIQMRIRPYPSGGQQGTVYQLSGVGSVSTADYLPLFNVARVTLTVASGRPSRKYYRLPVGEADQANGTFIPAKVSSLNTSLASFITTANLTDESGNVFTAATVVPTVGMRQLRRGSKRRATPVI